jgi:hypothetical protein
MNGVGYDQENRMILGWWNAKVAELVVVGVCFEYGLDCWTSFPFSFPLFLH